MRFISAPKENQIKKEKKSDEEHNTQLEFAYKFTMCYDIFSKIE